VVVAGVEGDSKLFEKTSAGFVGGIQTVARFEKLTRLNPSQSNLVKPSQTIFIHLALLISAKMSQVIFLNCDFSFSVAAFKNVYLSAVRPPSSGVRCCRA
jgi:hypothetical protein